MNFCPIGMPNELRGTSSRIYQANGLGRCEFFLPGVPYSSMADAECGDRRIRRKPHTNRSRGVWPGREYWNTFTAIRFELDQSGWIRNFRIYSTTGQLMQVLAQNEVLGVTGLFTWTGTDSQGKIVRPGYDILLVELYDLSGQVRGSVKP